MPEWHMHAADHGTHYSGVGTEWYARQYGRAVPVLVSENPEGEYTGWFDAEDELNGRTQPTLVCRKEVFDVQFHYGSQAEVERGRGRTVSLSIEELPHA